MGYGVTIIIEFQESDGEWTEWAEVSPKRVGDMVHALFGVYGEPGDIESLVKGLPKDHSVFNDEERLKKEGGLYATYYNEVEYSRILSDVFYDKEDGNAGNAAQYEAVLQAMHRLRLGYPAVRLIMWLTT